MICIKIPQQLYFTALYFTFCKRFPLYYIRGLASMSFQSVPCISTGTTLNNRQVYKAFTSFIIPYYFIITLYLYYTLAFQCALHKRFPLYYIRGLASMSFQSVPCISTGTTLNNRQVYKAFTSFIIPQPNVQLVYVAELKRFIPVPPETCLSSLFFLCHPNKKENILGVMFLFSNVFGRKKLFGNLREYFGQMESHFRIS